jgi:vancomycin resistance protein YoaR
MIKKRKISVTVDETVIREIEKVSEKTRIPKSHIAQKAFELWLKQETERKMAEGYETMAEEDMDMAEKAVAAQREILS